MPSQTRWRILFFGFVLELVARPAMVPTSESSPVCLQAPARGFGCRNARVFSSLFEAWSAYSESDSSASGRRNARERTVRWTGT